MRARLLNKAREEGREYNLVLTRYALERFLYRLSTSPHGSQFLLKGALLFDLWFDIPQRSTGHPVRGRPAGLHYAFAPSLPSLDLLPAHERTGR